MKIAKFITFCQDEHCKNYTKEETGLIIKSLGIGITIRKGMYYSLRSNHVVDRIFAVTDIKSGYMVFPASSLVELLGLFFKRYPKLKEIRKSDEYLKYCEAFEFCKRGEGYYD